MDTDHLRASYPALLDHMTSAGYSRNYIQVVRQELRLILENPERWESYEDILRYHQQALTNGKSLSQRKAILNLIASFDRYGSLPGEESGVSYFNSGLYYRLTDEYRALIDFYQSHADRSRKKESTIHNESHNAAAFLFHLQESGYDSLESVTEEGVLALLTNAAGRPSRSASYAGQIFTVLNGSQGFSPHCLRISMMIPSVRRCRKNIQYLRADEREKIREVLNNQDSGLNLRDRAIGCLLFYMGLRCCDVANLQLSDIDWMEDSISIIQQKTAEPLRLPLSATVGNAIYDYLTRERGISSEAHVFLSQCRPYKKLMPGSVGSSICDKIYRAANIRQNAGDRRGGHILRHNFATVMMEKGVSRAVISRTMGHSSPASTDIYLSADMVHLKACALSVEAFPVREGVFPGD